MTIQNKRPTIERLDEIRSTIRNSHGIDITLFARPEIKIEQAAVEELATLLDINQTVALLQEKAPDFFGGTEPEISRCIITPDFHKGSGVPIGTVLKTKGFVIPQAIGNDVNCGMRLHLTGLPADKVRSALPALEKRLRHLFFEGGRDIPMTGRQRRALFLEGLEGLMAATPKEMKQGLWRLFWQLSSDAGHVESRGSLTATSTYGLDDFIGDLDKSSRDGQIGSVGGGNHFCEILEVANIIDGTTARAYGLKKGEIVVMVHSGAVAIGHLCGSLAKELAKSIWPEALPHPGNGIYPLPVTGKHGAAYRKFRDMLHNAGNFAFANRMFLALMALSALEETCGEISGNLLYDAPHNFLWDEEGGQLHRKGACPARGTSEMEGTDFAWYGQPVLIPGSMGASSFVLAGQGLEAALSSACHGAGRELSRGDALHASDELFQEFLRNYRVVLPIDLNDPQMMKRPDIVRDKLAELKKEAPFAYKGIGSVVRTISEAGIARQVAELHPLLTVKG